MRRILVISLLVGGCSGDPSVQAISGDAGSEASVRDAEGHSEAGDHQEAGRPKTSMTVDAAVDASRLVEAGEVLDARLITDAKPEAAVEARALPGDMEPVDVGCTGHGVHDFSEWTLYEVHPNDCLWVGDATAASFQVCVDTYPDDGVCSPQCFKQVVFRGNDFSNTPQRIAITYYTLGDQKVRKVSAASPAGLLMCAGIQPGAAKYTP